MPFADDLAQCLQQYGISVDAGSLPDQDAFQQAWDYLKSWYSSLSQQVQYALDAATTDGNPSSQLLAYPSVNIAPALSALLAAFDAVSGTPLSTLIGYVDACIATALQGAEN